MISIDLKTVYKVFNEAGKIDLYEKIIEMNTKFIEIQEDNQSLRSEIKKLKNISKINKNLELRINFYWLKNKDSIENGPYCTRCWDKNNDLIRIPTYQNQHEYHYFECPECKNRVSNENYRASCITFE